MSNQKARKERLKQLVIYINNKREIDRKKLVSYICYHEGLRKGTAEEYINTLLDAEMADEVNGKIVSINPRDESQS